MKVCLSFAMVVLITAVGLAANVPPMTDLIIHLKADAITGLTDGATVSQWNDLATTDTVNGTVTQIGTNALPAYYSNVLNGKAVVRFTNSQVLGTASFAWPDVNAGVTILAVFTGDSSAQTAERLCGIGSSAGTGGQFFGWDVSTTATGTDGGSGIRFNNGKTLVLTNNPVDPNFHVGAIQIDQGAQYQTARYFVDDMNLQIFNNYANATNTLTLPATGNVFTVGTSWINGGMGTADFFSGDLAEILVYNRMLSDVEIEVISHYLAKEYNIPGNFNPILWVVSPSDGQLDVDTNADLNWGVNADLIPTALKLYFSDQSGQVDPAAPGSNMTPISVTVPANLDEVTYDVGPMNPSTTYYWRVDVDGTDPNGGLPKTFVGTMNSFTTNTGAPVVTSNPSALTVAAGSSAVFSVTATYAAGYAWYVEGNATALSNGGDISGADTATLTVNNVELADEGYYYCVASNSFGSTNSNSARLTTKRLVAHWTLDLADYQSGHYIDSSGEGHHADPNITPETSQFVSETVNPAKTHEALNLVPQPLAAADSGDWAPSEFTGQVTVSAWCRWAGTNGAWQGIVSNRRQTGVGNGNFYIEIRNDNGNVQFGAPTITALQSKPLPANEWTHVAITAGPSEIVIYLNGELYVARTPGLTVEQNVVPVYIGALNRDAAESTLLSTFNGVLDDVRIYNFAQDKFDVADLYYDIEGTALCLNPDNVDLQFDVAGGGTNGDEPDCTINLADFAIFAQSWLNCGLYPQIGCQ